MARKVFYQVLSAIVFTGLLIEGYKLTGENSMPITEDVHRDTLYIIYICCSDDDWLGADRSNLSQIQVSIVVIKHINSGCCLMSRSSCRQQIPDTSHP